MSGYNYKLIIELKAIDNKNIDIQDIVEQIRFFLTQYIELNGTKVLESTTIENSDHFELIFFNEYPIMSFYVFYEEIEGMIMYLNIIDLVKAASELMNSKDFFNKIIESIQRKILLTQAVLLFDPVYESYGKLFRDLKLKEKDFNIVAYFHS